MTVTTVVNQNNLRIAPADQATGTDFSYPNAGGVAIPANARSYRLQVDKAGLTPGHKYLTIAVEFHRSFGWSLDVSNAPDGWQSDPNTNELPLTGTNTIDYIASTVGSWRTGSDGQMVLVGEFPTAVRLHVMFSSGDRVANVTVQIADDFSLV